MTRTRENELDQIAAEVVRAGVARAVVVAVAYRDEGGFCVRTGAHGSSPDGEIDEDSVFDLASVSKPALALAAARCVRARKLTLSDELARWLPELAGEPSGALPLELFFAHRAGLEAHRPLFAPLFNKQCFERGAALLAAGRARRADLPTDPPADGYPPLYSDLGYLLAGEALARATGRQLDELLDEQVSAPLGLNIASARLWLARDPSFPRRVLPTETVRWRGGELRGVVHDENAWAWAGHGLAGQAGLFGTAASVAWLGASVLDALAGARLDWLEPAELLPLVRVRTGGSLRAGFDGKSGSQSAAGSLSHADVFGHLGFTGTSFWCDPVAESVAVLLTNRVCPTRENQKIREARPVVHDALFRYACKQGLPNRGQP